MCKKFGISRAKGKRDMSLGCRAYHKGKGVMVYNLVRFSEHVLVGRIEGTEQWIHCEEEELLFQRGTNAHDVLFRPIFEDDYLRDKEGNLYRIVFNLNARQFALYDMMKREEIPFESSEQLEVVGGPRALLPDVMQKIKEPFPTRPHFKTTTIESALALSNKEGKETPATPSFNLIDSLSLKEKWSGKSKSHANGEDVSFQQAEFVQMDVPLFMNQKKVKKRKVKRYGI